MKLCSNVLNNCISRISVRFQEIFHKHIIDIDEFQNIDKFQSLTTFLQHQTAKNSIDKQKILFKFQILNHTDKKYNW